MKNFLIISIISFLLLSCSRNSEEIVTEIKGEDIEQQMTQAYKAGVLALEKGDIFFATKKFNEAELLFPQSDWAPRSSLMAAYAYWSEGYYQNSVNELQRFLKLYPKYKNLDYVYYLLAINYYDSIVDEKKDLKPLTESQKYFNILLNEYPNTDYALDAKYKLELIQDMLAAKEIYIARHYIKKEKWIAAINRLNVVVNNYDTTVYIEEALHRLVEIYFIIGLEDEAKKYAQTLGYNYQSGEWYNQSYKIFNKDYKLVEKKKNTKKKEKLLDKIKSLLNE
jgi:outer membrane protein assembly factor BamD